MNYGRKTIPLSSRFALTDNRIRGKIKAIYKPVGKAVESSFWLGAMLLGRFLTPEPYGLSKQKIIG